MSVRRKFPDEEYRKSFRTPSGFQHLGESSANGDHTHLALIYESKEELLASVLPFLQSGLERGKFCIYVTSETPQAILLETMDTADFNFKAALEAGDLILLTEEEAYLENGEFDLKRMTESFQELTAKVDNEGYDGLRIAGEATWALEDDQRINHLVEYEEAINNYFRGRDCTALCIFSRNHFPPAILKKVIQTHPQLVFGGTVIQNFYYVPQGEHSDGENTLQMVERQIQSLIEYTHELREHEAWLTGQKEAFREAVKGAPLKTSLGVLIRTTIKQIEGDVRAAFYTAGTDGKRLHHVTGMPEAYAEAVDGFEIGPDSQACGLAMYKGEPVITPDVRKDPKWKSLIELTEEFDYRACWDFPVRTAGGPTLGTFAMYFREPRDATEYELKYIGILAHAAAIIISQYNEAEDHKQAEEDLRKREERLSAFIETSSATAFRINPDWTELYHRYGKTSRSYTSGSNTVLVDKYIPPNDQPVVRKNIAKAIQTKSAFEMEHRVIKKDGSVGWSASRAIPIMKEGEIVEWFGTASDITKRKQQEKREQFLLKLNDALRLLSDAVEIKQAVTRIVGEQIQADRALYAEIGSDGESIHIADSYSCKSLSKIEGTLNVKDFSSAVVDSLRSGKTIVVEDVSALPGITEEEIDAYAALDIASIVAVPLVKGDRWVSNLIIYHSSFRRWTAEEVQLLEEAAELTWAAVERARAEESLYENEERLRLALDVEELGLWQFDLQNQSLMMSDICKQNLGLTPDIALNFKQFQQMMHPEDRDLWSEKLRKTLQNGEMLSAEFRFSRPSGKINWIYAKGRVLNNSEGTRAKIIGITQNITHRKKQEKLEQEQSRLLKYIASDRSLRDTLTALCEAIPLLGQGVRASIVLVDNEKSTFQTAIAPDLLPSWGKAPDGTPVDDLQIGTCGEAIFNGEAIGCKNVKEDEQRSDEWQNLCLANGIMATYSVPIFDDKGNTRGSFMLCFSIPREPNEWELQLVEFGAQISSIALKRHQTKKMIREYNGRLEEKVEQRTKKLVTYQTKLRKLVNRLSKAEEQERHWLAEELHDNLGQLLAVSKMKLDFAGLDSKDTNISEAADLLDEAIVYTRELMSSLKPPDSLGDKSIRSAVIWVIKKMEEFDLMVHLEDDEKPKPLSKEARATVLRATRELLFNVIKHSGEKKARLKLSRTNGEVQIVVEDSGIGFDPETEKLSDETDKGFGLFDIRERLDLLEGDLKIESAPGDGTRAVITIPLSVSEEDENKITSGGGKQLETVFTEDTNGITVLLVDDHTITREGIAKVIEYEDDLKLAGEAKNGREAIELARETNPDVIVMDINMPEMNGIEATKKIKAEWPDIQIVGLSFHEEGDTADEMRKAGASAFVTKSNAVDQLCEAIRTVNDNDE